MRLTRPFGSEFMGTPSPGRMLDAVARARGSAALAAAAIIGLVASGWLGYGYLQNRRAALAQQRAMRQVELANLDLQAALDRLRDETRTTLQQLNAERSRLQARVPKAAPVPAAPRTAAVAPVPARPAVAPAVDRPKTAIAPGEAKNFTAPAWVPDFFSNEAGPIRGTTKSRAAAAGAAKPRKLRARHLLRRRRAPS